MKERKDGFLRIIRRNPIFSKVFFGLLLLSLVVLSAFYLAVSGLTARYQREQAAADGLNLLARSASSMESTLDALAQSMGQVLWNRDFVDYMMKPVADQDLSYRILFQLRSCATGSPMVKRAVFFATLSDTVFRDDFQLGDRQHYSDQTMLEACAMAEMSPTAENRMKTGLIFHGGRLFLVQSLDIASPIGTLAYELDLETLRTRFFQLEGEGREILVYDSAHQPLYAQAETLDWTDASAFTTAETLAGNAATGRLGDYYRHTAGGWEFLLPVDQGGAALSAGEMAELYVPAFLLIALFSLLFAGYVTRTTYRPIGNLLRMVTVPTGDPAGGDVGMNEVDYLESAYFDAVEGRAQLEGVVNTIAPEIIESMLKNLLVGKSLPEERVREILAGVGDPFQTPGCFFVIACVMDPPKERELTDVEVNLHLLAIRNLVAGLAQQSYQVYDIRTEKLTVALVCCFSIEQPTGTLTQEYRRVKRMLQCNAELLPCQLRCERGNIYQNLGDIRYSYREAVEKIQYNAYMQTEGPEPEPVLPQELNQRYFQQQAKQIVALTAENAWLQAKALLMRLLDEIGDRAPDLEQYKALVQSLMDETLERVIAFPLTQEDQAALNRCRMRLEDAGLDREQDVIRAVQEDYEMIFQMVATYSRKNRYKYVETAKAYLADNYMDSDLSLNKVSDHVGISASYLSELFNEVAQEKFSSYLSAYRVEKARQLLQATKLTSKEIGFRCGFNSVQNFIRVFKKYTGRTPGQYREEPPGV